MTYVCILDYGSGNLQSVYNLVSQFSEVVISNEVAEIEKATHFILPGVGAFGSAMRKINQKLPIEVIKEQLRKGKFFLGICVGMQVMAEFGTEFEVNAGLGMLPGKVERMNSMGNPLPHIGWNNIRIKNNHPLLMNLNSQSDFYFVHSFVLSTSDSFILAETEYGMYFPSIVGYENIFGVQFHPEKSQSAGRQLFKNFLSLK